jgi:hypothetical protein
VYEAYGEDQIQKTEVRQRAIRDYMKRDGRLEGRDRKKLRNCRGK